MTKIGPFEIVDILHRGPQQLFRARTRDGREVAIKAVSVAGLNPETRERFTREAETCRALDHPNLIRVFEMGEADGMLYQAMEMLEGADLGKVMAEGRELSWDARLDIMEQVSAGLQYAHEHKLVHRDIKPANLFLENSGRVRVLDFGMVRTAESELTRVGSSLGTLNYMAPEQIRGERCTAATDVFSAGIVFFQLASGRHPFSARDRNLGQVVSAIVFEAPPKLSALAPDAPEGLEFILERALEKDPARRPQTAADLKQAISLCRTAVQFAVPAKQPAAPSAAPASTMAEGEKTRVLARPSAAPPMDEKTRVMPRVAPAVAPAAALPPKPPAPKPVPRKIVAKPAAAVHPRYCPACTFANPSGAVQCQKCGTPFAASGSVAAPRSFSWPLFIATAVAILLAIALAAVLIFKK